jgi:signal recognition particle GTPase
MGACRFCRVFASKQKKRSRNHTNNDASCLIFVVGINGGGKDIFLGMVAFYTHEMLNLMFAGQNDKLACG